MKTKKEIQAEIKKLNAELKNIPKESSPPSKIWNAFLSSCTNGFTKINEKAKINLAIIEQKEKSIVLKFLESNVPLDEEELASWQNKCAEMILASEDTELEEGLIEKLKQTRKK